MTKPLLLDTDVFVDFLRRQPEAVAYVKAHSDQIVLSSVVAAELYAGANDHDLGRLDEFLSLFQSVPVTVDIARIAGRYKRQYQASHGVGLADAIIAATAEAIGADLKTFNVKHYPMLKGLKPPYGKK